MRCAGGRGASRKAGGPGVVTAHKRHARGCGPTQGVYGSFHDVGVVVGPKGVGPLRKCSQRSVHEECAERCVVDDALSAHWEQCSTKLKQMGGGGDVPHLRFI